MQRIFTLFLALLVFSPCLPLRAQKDMQFFPLADVRPGLKGVGRTVFQGNKIQEFQVELLGVLKNVLAPKRDAILARLSGPAIDKAGVAEGMSGSPVYVDGKLLGAVSAAFPFSKEPYTLITPIQDMLQVAPGPDSEGHAELASSIPWYSAAAPSPNGIIQRWIPNDVSTPQLWARLLQPWAGQESIDLGHFRLPLRFNGFDRSVISEYTPLLRNLGFEPMGGGVLSAGSSSDISSGQESTPTSDASIVPGS